MQVWKSPIEYVDPLVCSEITERGLPASASNQHPLLMKSELRSVRGDLQSAFEISRTDPNPINIDP